MSLESGFVLGPYVIRSHLGKGGMGEVYRATDSRLGRDVAVKVLPERLIANREALIPDIRWDGTRSKVGYLQREPALV